MHVTGRAHRPDQGEHTYRVRAKDPAGNVDASPEVRTLTVDSEGPATTIDQKPDAPTNETTADFEFSCEAGATFECTLDSGPAEDCNDGTASYDSLAEGDHTFSVVATDTHNNAGPAATHTWTVDTTAPDTSLDSGPDEDSFQNTDSAMFGFGSPDDNTATFECKLDSGDYGSCSVAQDVRRPRRGRPHVQRPRQGCGRQRRRVARGRATGRSTRSSRTPRSPATRTPVTQSRDIELSWTTDDESDVTWECRRGTDPFADCTSRCPTPAWPTATTRSRSARPTRRATSTSPAASSRGPSTRRARHGDRPEAGRPVERRLAELHVPLHRAGSCLECQLDSQTATDCTSGSAGYTNVADGEHTFKVTATDAAGNVDGTPAEHTWTVDTGAPETTLTAPDGFQSSAGAHIEFTSEAGATFECKLDTAAFADCDSPEDLTGLSEGEHTFQVRATDGAGNTEDPAQSATWTVDLTDPEANVDAGPDDLVNEDTAHFEFSSSEPTGAQFDCKLDNGSFTDCDSGEKDYSNLDDGDHTFVVRTTDRSGRTGHSDAYELDGRHHRAGGGPDRRPGRHRHVG